MDILAILNRIEVLLKETGHSKSELYGACSVSASAISQWKSGKTSPATKSLQSIADYLNVSYEYLVSGVGQKEKEPAPEGERDSDLSSAFFRLKQGLEPYDLSESDVDFLVEVYKAHIKRNQ